MDKDLVKDKDSVAAPVTMSFFILHGVSTLFSVLCADHLHALLTSGANVQHNGRGKRLELASIWTGS